MTLVNVSKRSATLFNLSLAFIFLLKLFRGQIYSVFSFSFIFSKKNFILFDIWWSDTVRTAKYEIEKMPENAKRLMQK